MGSSASIMQATLRAGGEEQNSTITFHCQELCETAELTELSSTAEKSADNSVPVVVLAESSKEISSSEAYSSAEVTRYFPILQAQSYTYTEPQNVPLTEAPILVTANSEGRTDSKEQRENYYYSCEYCSKRFMFKGCLNRHLARHVKSVSESDIRIAAPRSHTAQSVEKTALLAEVRYRLKDPRLYEQQGTCKSTVKSKPAPKNTARTTTRTRGGRGKKWKEKCRLCEGEGHNMNNCKIIPRMLGQNVLAICSCLKCNKAFEDVEQLKEHINSMKCKGEPGSWGKETTAATSCR